MTYETLLFEVSDGLAKITLNRPGAANSLNGAMAHDLMMAAIRCDEDPDIRAVLLTGTGKMFCAGGDLKTFSGFGEDMGARLKEITIYLHAATSRFSRMNPPLVVAVNGVAAGAVPGYHHDVCLLRWMAGHCVLLVVRPTCHPDRRQDLAAIRWLVLFKPLEDMEAFGIDEKRMLAE